MSQCPKCFNSIQVNQEHFGTLFTCPSCSNVFFVDWNGQPEAAVPDESSVNTAVAFETATSPQEFVFNSELQNQDLTNSSQNSEQNVFGSTETFQPIVENNYLENDNPQPTVTINNSDSMGTNSNVSEISEKSNPSHWNFSASVDEAPELEEPNLVESNEPKNYSEQHDLSPVGAGQDLLVTYDLIIEGLDLKSVWSDVKDVLREPRLKLEADGLEKRILAGVLIIPQLSPLAVHFIVQRIKSFNVKIHWRVHGN